MHYTLRIADTPSEFQALEAPWGRLLAESPADNYFLRWEWMWQWWKVFAGPGDRLAILLLEEGNEIVAIAPFYVRTKFLGGVYPVRRMMFIGTQEEDAGDVGSDYLDLLYRSGSEKSAVSLFMQAMVTRDLCDEICLSRMDRAAKTFPLFQKEAEGLRFLTLVSDEVVSPFIMLPSSWEEYLNSLSPSMRYKIRNERRKAEKSGAVSVMKVETGDDIPQGIEELTKLHKKRWESKGQDGVFEDGRFIRFHRELMPTMLSKGHLELTILAENGVSKAALYNIAYRNKIYFYQSGIDTADRKSAFGYVLHSYCIEAAIRRGMVEYDFLPKGEGDDYKERFSTGRRSVASLYMACKGAVKGMVTARESARGLYRRMKPLLVKAS